MHPGFFGDRFHDDRRQHERFFIRLPATAIQDGYETVGEVRNVSGGGALFQIDPISATAIYSRPLELEIDGVGRYPAKIMWRSTVMFGLSFQIDESISQLLHTRLMALTRSDPTTGTSD